MSEVQQFFAKKTIFITGVTGFLGRVLLCKLLCSCPDINRVYVLIRGKKGKTLHQRFQELLDDPIFNNVKELSPKYEQKITPISGDCSLPMLGISEVDKQVIKNEVNIIFHVAATVNFDAPLREAAYINIRSLDHLLDIANDMTNLQSFSYVSTAFSTIIGRQTIEEKFHDAPIKSEHLLSLIELLNDEQLEEITPLLLKEYPNTYIYTKSIAEDVCRCKGSNIPLSIFRPAIVVASEKEPAAGYINNMYGPTGIISSCLMGILKVMHIDEHCKADVVPCDYVINALIVSSYDASKSWAEDKSIRIYNYSNTMTKFSHTWRTMEREVTAANSKFAFSKCISFPILIMTKYMLQYKILSFLLHIMPATIIDFILMVFHQKPRCVQMYQKIHKHLEVRSFFATQEWIIHNNNIDKLWTKLSPQDKKIFNYDLNDLNVSKYYEIFLKGIRRYIVKDKDHNLPQALKRRKRLMALHYLFLSTIVFLFAYCVISSYQAYVLK